MCIQMRSGVEIWAEAEKVLPFQEDLEKTKQHFFGRFNGETVNSADVVGVFKADTMQEYTRRKNGQWKCNGGSWHDKGEKCQCASLEEKNYIAERAKRIAECGKCNNGWVSTASGGVAVCDCIKDLN